LAGDAAKALKAYERASQLKPSMLDALAGMGTCATRLRRWHVAHSAAMKLLAVQPDNETALLLLNNAILSAL
jgi:cytochrome c-type biogenesis protein CcmH/NrfG